MANLPSSFCGVLQLISHAKAVDDSETISNWYTQLIAGGSAMDNQRGDRSFNASDLELSKLLKEIFDHE
ncbi:hypothetical protein ACTXT7_006311 [Hymenolepis weldensis]